jgi:predicted RNA-binding protein YlqC (UPF0109 family)
MNAKDVGSLVRSLFQDILSEFVLHPDDLKVCTVEMRRTIIVQIFAAGRDVGRVIGERGAHFNALKILGAMIGLKHGVAVELEPVPDPKEPGKSERYDSFKARDDWRKEIILALIGRTASAALRFPDAISVSCLDANEASSIVEIVCASAEPAGLIEPVEQSLKALFNAVGKANGRTIFVSVIPSRKVDPPQPKTAAGRNARELRH